MIVINKSDVIKRCGKLLDIILTNPKMCKSYTMLCEELAVNLTKNSKEVRYYIRCDITINELMKLFDIMIYVIGGIR